MANKILRSTDQNYVEFEVLLRHTTEKAILIFDGDQEVWITKSQMEEPMEHLGKGMVRFVIPEWLAIEKELI